VYKNLYIGSKGDAERQGNEFDHVVSVGEKLTNGDKIFEIYDSYHNENNMKTFRKAIDYVYNIMDKYEKILIHCYEGKSRSASVIIGVMMKHGITFDKAWSILKERHKPAGPNIAFVKELRKSELTDVEELVNRCYKEILKRNADLDGLYHYRDRFLLEGIDEDDLKDILKNSKEYKRRFDK
jgi:hypothetical protein